jgi:predicted nucleic acid-binding protein
MKNVFLDANVVIDYLGAREPFSTEAALLFEQGEKAKINIFVSAVSFNVIYYVLRQKMGHKSTIDVLDRLAELVRIVGTSSEIITQAISSGNSDFEDAIQYYSALSNRKIDAIITRDPKGYKKSELPVLSPLEALKVILP